MWSVMPLLLSAETSDCRKCSKKTPWFKGVFFELEFSGEILFRDFSTDRFHHMISVVDGSINQVGMFFLDY